MRTTFYLAAALGAVMCRTAVVAAQTGNGAPSGPHFNLNIIGVSHDKSPNMAGGSGNVIFVELGTGNSSVSTKILLRQSAAGVFDRVGQNGTDGEAAFSRSAPGYFAIWARALGKPGGQATI